MSKHLVAIIAESSLHGDCMKPLGPRQRMYFEKEIKKDSMFSSKAMLEALDAIDYWMTCFLDERQKTLYQCPYYSRDGCMKPEHYLCSCEDHNE